MSTLFFRIAAIETASAEIHRHMERIRAACSTKRESLVLRAPFRRGAQTVTNRYHAMGIGNK